MGSSVGMDKDITKIILKSAGIPVVPSITILNKNWISQKEEIVRKINGQFQLPIFVKPCNSGSSIGITKVKHGDELLNALNFAFEFDNKVLIEQGLSVREIEISAFGNEFAEVSLPGEIHPAAEFYDYSDKYHSGASWSEIPAKLGKETVDIIQQYAKTAYSALNLDGMARIDFFITKETNEIFLNEVNTIPGFTPISMYPKMWEASGLPYTDLIEKLIDLAFERHDKKEKIAANFINLK